MMLRKIALAPALLALSALGGCDWFKPAPPPAGANNAMAADNIVEPAEPATSVNAATPTDANAAAASELRATPPAPDAQTQDDADATGMTAHVRRDETVTNTMP